MVGACAAKETQEVDAAGWDAVLQPMMLSMLMEEGWVSCDKGGKVDAATGFCGAWTLEYARWANTLDVDTGATYAAATGIGGWEGLALVKLVTVASAEFGAVGVSTYALRALGPAFSLPELSSCLTSGDDSRERSEGGKLFVVIEDIGWVACIWV